MQELDAGAAAADHMGEESTVGEASAAEATAEANSLLRLVKLSRFGLFSSKSRNVVVAEAHLLPLLEVDVMALLHFCRSLWFCRMTSA